MSSRILSLQLQGYRPFRDLSAQLDNLEVIAGANGSGKSSLFEFLRFLRNSIYSDIPPEIVEGSIGQRIFHVAGPDRFRWTVEIDTGHPVPLHYEGELLGPVGKTHVASESVKTAEPLGQTHDEPYIFMDIREREGVVNEAGDLNKQDISLKRPNQLALSAMTNPALDTLYKLREYIRGWRFYNAFNINNQAIRRSVPIEQEPVLHEDAGNLSSVLHYLMTEHRTAFDELQHHLRMAVPGFKGLNVKARGGPGEVIAFWQEGSVDEELSLADLSDGILRLICWITLSVHPSPPTLICIDEPGQGVHPRTLPILAGLFQKVAERTQVLLATHNSYFLKQFDIDQIAVMRKEDGGAQFLKPKNSKVLMYNLEEFGTEELEAMHRSDELERLA
ncbi:AAA family ATPase [Salisaeta longa]|uniref:AAA family ATPase n=1 Tax=Salisaeta longa TaxID=503170 RepID=UPI00041C3702|nr:AAA family ATPase [Salisaeta longa]